jgi:hypothetical protein
MTLSSTNSSFRQSFNKCKGFHFQKFGHAIYTEFPFQRFFFDQLQFVFENKNFHTQRCAKNSYKCTPNELSNEINRDCYNLQYNNQFTSIFESIKNDNNKHLNRKYLNYNLFVERLESKDEKIYRLKLENLRKDFQLICYKNQIDMHKRFLNLIAQEDVPRLSQILTVCLNQKTGIRGIIDKFLLAAGDLYHAKGWNENDIDLATLVLRMGGPTLLYAFTDTNILPSSSVTYKVI